MMSQQYVDEEEALGFKVWVAELELMVGNARGKRKVDTQQCFQLLQKLVATLDRTGRQEVRDYQRRCEDALIDILLKGAPPPVRRLICEALGRLYSMGDQLPLFSRVSSLQLFLGTKEAFSKETSEDIRLGALECMTSLYYSQGRYLSIGVHETTSLATKYCLKSSEEKTRCAALALLAAAVEGVGGNHRKVQEVQQEAYRTAEKLAKDRESMAIRLAAAAVIRSLARAGGAFLWANSMSGYEDAKAACLGGLEDPNPEVRTAFAHTLGEIAVASSSEAAADSVRALEKKPRYKAAQEKALGEVVAQSLVAPFVEASVAGNRTACTALAQAWVVYLTAVRCAGALDAAAFVDLAMRVLDALGQACVAAVGYQEKALVPGEGELGMGTGSGERPHAQAFALYVLRVGVIEQLGEAGQRLLLEKLLGVLGAPLGANTPVGVVTLEAMTLLLEVLGEVSAEARAAVEEPLFGKLAGPHCCLRMQAAGTLATLSIAEPSSAARLLQTALSRLQEALSSLVEASGTGAAATDRSRLAPPSTPRGVGVAKLKPNMNAVHGWALGTAALLAASVRLPLGVPAALATSALQLAATLIANPRSQQASAASLEREAGYILLGSLCLSLPPEVLGERQLQLLELFAPALGAEAAGDLDKQYTSNMSNLDHIVAMELWWRTAALEALLGYTQGVVMRAAKADQGRLCKKVAALLKPTLDFITAHAALQEPARGKGGPTGMFAGAAALLQLRLLEVYLALPAASSYILEHEALTKLCMRAVRSMAAGGPLAMAESALRPWLGRANALLGPWRLGQDPLESALFGFEGVAGGPAVHPWEAGRREGVGYAMVEDTEAGGPPASAACAPYPQPKGLGAALLEAQLSLLGTLLESVSAPNQVAIVEALLGIVEGGPQKKKDRDPQRRAAAAAIASGAALAGLGRLTRGSGRGSASPELALRVKALADEVAEESAGSPALQRAAADLYAASAVLAPDSSLAVQLVKGLCKEAAETASLQRRAGLALAVGSVASAAGGLSLQAVLPLAVQTLIAVAEASDKSICLWILHALLACANAAGLAFVPHVKPTLGLAQGVLLSEDSYSTPGLLPAIGRLANAMVAVLGPEYSLGSAAYYACKSIINDMRSLESGSTTAGGSAMDAVSAALETVLYAQMLVLFAPKAVPAKSHVQVLVSTLLSRQPRLRKAAADTLRHLAERDAQSVLTERIEPVLFAALDSETDPGIASQIKATIRTLLIAGAPEEPSRWLALCGDVVTAAAPGTTMHSTESKSSLENGGRGEVDEDDDEASTGAAPPPPAAPAQSGPATTSPGVGGALGCRAGGKAEVTPRLRTRLFAARCLLQIPGLVVGTDPRHLDLAAAQAAGSGDWLVLRLQLLIDMGFRMASGQLEALRPLGVKLMKAVVKRFGEVPDPMAEGQKLLELYQAQVVSAIRASLSAGSSPTLQAAGATLAATFLEKGLAGGDAAVLDRLMALLSAPVVQWGAAHAQEQTYAEWVDVRAKVALLEAHAHCAVLAAGSADEATRRVVAKAQAPHAAMLMDSWLGLLQDYVVLATQPPAVQLAYRPKLCSPSGLPPGLAAVAKPGASAEGSGGDEAAAAQAAPAAAALSGAPPVAVIAAAKPFLERSWPAALDACTCMLAQQQQQPAGEEAPARERHQALLDLCQVAICSATEEVAASNDGGGGGGSGSTAWGAEAAGGGGLATALKALQRLTGPAFVGAGLLPMEEVAELTALLLQLLRQVMLPLVRQVGHSGQVMLPRALPAAALSAAEVLKQLAAAEVAQAAAAAVGPSQPPHPLAATIQQLLAAAEACAQFAVPGYQPASSGGVESPGSGPLAPAAAPEDSRDQAAVLGPALDCAKLVVKGVITHVESGAEVLALMLQRSLLLGTSVLLAASNPEQLAVAAGYLLDLASIVGPSLRAPAGSSASEGTPSPLGVVAATAASLAQQAQQLLCAGHASQLGPTLTAMLPVAAAVASSQAAVAVAQPAAAGSAAAAELDEDDWGDDAFESALSGPMEEPVEALSEQPISSAGAAEAPAAAGEGEGGVAQGEAAVAEAAVAPEGGSGEEAPSEEPVGGTAGPESSGGVAPSEQLNAAATLQLCLGVLQEGAESADPAIALQLLQALRLYLQQLSAQAVPSAAAWGLRCAGVVLPPAAARMHGLLQGTDPLGELDVQVAAETLKVTLVAATSVAGGAAGEAAQAPLMQLLLPLLIEAAAPPAAAGRSVAPQLAEMAMKLITHLASGQAAPAFKAAVAALPVAAKQRLQAALQGGSSAGQTAAAPQAGPSISAAAAKPTILLKSFAALSIKQPTPTTVGLASPEED